MSLQFSNIFLFVAFAIGMVANPPIQPDGAVATFLRKNISFRDLSKPPADLTKQIEGLFGRSGVKVSGVKGFEGLRVVSIANVSTESRPFFLSPNNGHVNVQFVEGNWIPKTFRKVGKYLVGVIDLGIGRNDFAAVSYVKKGIKWSQTAFIGEPSQSETFFDGPQSGDIRIRASIPCKAIYRAQRSSIVRETVWRFAHGHFVPTFVRMRDGAFYAFDDLVFACLKNKVTWEKRRCPNATWLSTLKASIAALQESGEEIKCSRYGANNFSINLPSGENRPESRRYFRMGLVKGRWVVTRVWKQALQGGQPHR